MTVLCQTDVSVSGSIIAPDNIVYIASLNYQQSGYINAMKLALHIISEAVISGEVEADLFEVVAQSMWCTQSCNVTVVSRVSGDGVGANDGTYAGGGAYGGSAGSNSYAIIRVPYGNLRNSLPGSAGGSSSSMKLIIIFCFTN